MTVIRWKIRSYPTLMMISPRYDMHAQWPNNVQAQGKWADVLPKWARETRDEWERLEREGSLCRKLDGARYQTRPGQARPDDTREHRGTQTV